MTSLLYASPLSSVRPHSLPTPLVQTSIFIEITDGVMAFSMADTRGRLGAPGRAPGGEGQVSTGRSIEAEGSGPKVVLSEGMVAR